MSFGLVTACGPSPAARPGVGVSVADSGVEPAELAGTGTDRPATDGAEGIAEDDDWDGVFVEDDRPPATEPAGLAAYVAACARALGPPPGFDCFADAVPLPATVDGAPIDPATVGPTAVCDRPSVLEASCSPHSRVGWKPGVDASGAVDLGVDWVFTCRSRDGAAGPGEGGRFHDIALIGHRPETGATCFFQALPEGFEPVAVSPAAAGAADFWLPPEGVARAGCVECHAADPWIHTPFIDQARRPDDPSSPLVPSGGGLDAPYHVVGAALAAWPRPLMHLAPAGNACVGCHRVGLGRPCDGHARYAAGDPGALPVSASARAYPASHWMPPEHIDDIDAWDDVFASSLRQLVACCRAPEAAGCGLSPVPEGARGP